MNNKDFAEDMISLLLSVTTAVLIETHERSLSMHTKKALFIHAPVQYIRHQHKLIVLGENEEDLPAMPEALNLPKDILTSALMEIEQAEEIVRAIEKQSHIKLENLTVKIKTLENFFPEIAFPALETYLLTQDLSLFSPLPEAMTIKEFLNTPISSQRPLQVWNTKDAVYKPYEAVLPSTYITRQSKGKGDLKKR